MQNPAIILVGLMILAIVALVIANVRSHKKVARTHNWAAGLKRTLEPLRKYQVIVDVEAEAKRIKNDADTYAGEVQARAATTIEALTRDARETTRKSKAKSQELIDSSIRESKRILDTSKIHQK